MSSSFINAKAPSRQEPAETESPKLEIHFGVFFHGGNAASQLCRELAACYKQGNDCKHYEILQEVYYDTVVDTSADSRDDETFATLVSSAVGSALRSLGNCLAGYASLNENLTLCFDVFGVDVGVWPAICFCNVVEPGRVASGNVYIFDVCMADYAEGGMLGDFRRLGSKVVLNSYSFLDSANGNVQEMPDGETGPQPAGPDGDAGRVVPVDGVLKARVTYDVGYGQTLYMPKFGETDKEKLLDSIQLALDVAGFVPLFGAIPDLLNAGISACRGNWGEAALSLLAAIPIAEYFAGAGKVAGRMGKAGKAATDSKGASNVISADFRKKPTGAGDIASSAGTAAGDNVVSLERHKAMKEGTVVEISKWKGRKLKRTGTDNVPVGDDVWIQTHGVEIKTDTGGTITTNSIEGVRPGSGQNPFANNPNRRGNGQGTAGNGSSSGGNSGQVGKKGEPVFQKSDTDKGRTSENKIVNINDISAKLEKEQKRYEELQRVLKEDELRRTQTGQKFDVNI